MVRPLLPRLRALGQKWMNRAIGAQQDYVNAVTQPETARVWQQNAAAAADTYNQAMQQVIAENRWGNVMANISPDVYLAGVRTKAGRRVEGIRAAVSKWEAGYRPIAEAIDNVLPTLPPRGPKMSDANINRFLAVIRAIHEAALRRRGAIGAGVGSVAVPQVQSPQVGQSSQTQQLQLNGGYAVPVTAGYYGGYY